jgi:hypothetical protein
MALSPNYKWAEPDNASLVRNGAQDIRTLGDAIDTSVWNVGFGQAGKNKIINGDFAINQRNFTSTTTNGQYGFDRFRMALSGATATYSAQTFTAGAAPVAGYESRNFARIATTVGNDLCRIENLIEDVRTFAGQTITLSFWAKGTNPTTAGNLAVNFNQTFGTGGSPSSSVTGTQQTFVLTANWTRYSFSFAIPSISGKTLGTNNDSTLQFWFGQGTSVSADSWTLDLWGVQAEVGEFATPFQTATGNRTLELQACQRFYVRFGYTTSLYSAFPGAGSAYATTGFAFNTVLPVTMRAIPHTIESADLRATDGVADYALSSVTLSTTASSPNVGGFFAGATGLTQYRSYAAALATTSSGYLAFSAEM